MKWIILVLSMFFITGCYDYKELNQLSLISGIGVDYDEEYTVTLEVINTSVSPEASSEYEERTLLYEGTGSSFYLAYENALRKLDQVPYLYQTQLIIMSEDAAREDLSSIMDSMLRESRLNNAFYAVLVKDISANELLKIKTPDEPIVSAGIVSHINNITSSSYLRFDDLVNLYLKEGVDISLLTVSIIEEEITIENIGIFNDSSFVSILDDEHSEVINLLSGRFKQLSFEDDGIGVILNDIKSDLTIDDGKIKINVETKGTIKELKDEENLRDDEIFIELSEKFSDLVKEEVIELVELLKDYNTDILGFGDLIYRDNPDNYYDDVFLDTLYDVNVDIKINKNGFLFEVIR